MSLLINYISQWLPDTYIKATINFRYIMRVRMYHRLLFVAQVLSKMTQLLIKQHDY